MTPDARPLLEVSDLGVSFPRETGRLVAVDGLSYTVGAGEALAIVGESGSGKSVGVRAMLGLLPSTASIDSGSVRFLGRDLIGMRDRDLRRIRGNSVALVFQNAMDAMNPTLTLEQQLTEHLLWHGICGRSEARRRAVAALADVGIPEPEKRLKLYPFQLSGGMRQRATIAIAIVSEPKLLIADEPTTAVDVTIQRQVLDLLRRFKDRGMAMILITHDFGVARYLADRAIVMYAGRVMESGSVGELLDAPRHPYSRGLIDSCVELGGRNLPLVPIPGNPPDLARKPPGCPFHPRCSSAVMPRCREAQQLVAVAPGRQAACWRALDD